MEDGIDKNWLLRKRQREQEEFAEKAKTKIFMLIEIVISCQNLPSLDTFPAADPLIAFYTEEEFESDNWILKGQTECKKDTTNPIFEKSINMAYYFDTEERIKLELYDVDNFKEGMPLSKHTFVGESIVLVSDIVKSKMLITRFHNEATRKYQKLLDNKDTKLMLRMEEINEKNSVVNLKFSSWDIEASRGLIFYKIKRSRDDDDYVTAYTSENIRNAKFEENEWDEFQIQMTLLCNGDEYKNLKFEVYEWQK